MSTTVLKQLVVELTRGGCRVETLAYDPPAITFRSPAGSRCALTHAEDDYRLEYSIDTASTGAHYATLREVVRAACRS